MSDRPVSRRHLSRDITTLAVPMLVSSLAELMMGFVDTAVLGRYGSVSLAAVALSVAVHSVFVQILGALAIGYQITTARLLGAGDRAAVASLLRSLAAGGFVVAIAVALAVTVAAPAIFSVLTTDTAVAAGASAYLQIRIWSLVPFVFAVLLRMTCECDRRPAVVMRVMLVAQAVNAVLAPVLVFGWVGPELGIRGAAIGSLVASSLSAVLLAATVGRQFLTSPRQPPGTQAALGKTLRLGTPEALNMGFDYLGTLVFVAIIGLIGTTELAAGRIAMLLVMLLFVVCMNFGIATQILMGRALGREADRERALEVYRHSRVMLVAGGLALGLLSPLWAWVAGWLFTNDEDVRATAYLPMLVVGTSTVLMMLTAHATAALRAFGRTRVVMAINLLAVWLVLVPVGYLAVRFADTQALAWAMVAFVGYFATRSVASHIVLRQSIAVSQPAREVGAATP